MSPPGRSKCFVWLYGDHLLFPVDDLWPTFCTIWISALWILNIEFDVANFFFILKIWSCIFKNWIFAVKEFKTKKYAVWKCLCLLKNRHKKITLLHFKCSLFKFKNFKFRTMLNDVIFSFVKWQLSIIQIQIVLSYKLQTPLTVEH